MSSEPILRPEFNGAIESLRREIQTMGSNLDHHLQNIARSLEKLREETGKVAVLEARNEAVEDRVKALEANDKARTAAIRTLVGGVVVSLIGHLLPYLFRK